MEELEKKRDTHRETIQRLQQQMQQLRVRAALHS